MIRSLLTATAVLSLGAVTPAFAKAAPCRDAKGHFTKCAPAKPAPAAKCRNAKGQFAKCGTPGATPAK